jgi:hypothetical protein
MNIPLKALTTIKILIILTDITDDNTNIFEMSENALVIIAAFLFFRLLFMFMPPNYNK